MNGRITNSTSILSWLLIFVFALATYSPAYDGLSGATPVAQPRGRATHATKATPQTSSLGVVMHDWSGADAAAIPNVTFQQLIRPNHGWIAVPTAPTMAGSSSAKTEPGQTVTFQRSFQLNDKWSAVSPTAKSVKSVLRETERVSRLQQNERPAQSLAKTVRASDRDRRLEFAQADSVDGATTSYTSCEDALANLGTTHDPAPSVSFPKFNSDAPRSASCGIRLGCGVGVGPSCGIGLGPGTTGCGAGSAGCGISIGCTVGWHESECTRVDFRKRPQRHFCKALQL